jgi:hypothetical protein
MTINGSFLKGNASLKEDVIQTWGRYVGQIHRLTKNYKPSVNIESAATMGTRQIFDDGFAKS